MSSTLTIAVLPPTNPCATLFSPAAWRQLSGFGKILRNESADANLDEEQAKVLLADADVCITSWGSPRLSPAVVKAAPRLKLLCHAAGSVKPFVSEAVWERGIKVTSAAAAIAVGVAETTLGWIIVAAKQALVANQAVHAGGWKREMRFPAGDLPGKRIGIVGASHVGRNVIRLLAQFDVEILLYDPYVTARAAAELGAKKVTLDDLMSTADIISLHAPKTDETHHMINAKNLALVRDGVTLINTARGSLIDEAAFVEHLKTGRIWAILDVTDPEPPVADHPFRSLPNVVLTPHIAGTVDTGRTRIGECVTEEVRRFAAGEPQKHEVTREMLSHIG